MLLSLDWDPLLGGFRTALALIHRAQVFALVHALPLINGPLLVLLEQELLHDFFRERELARVSIILFLQVL